MNFAKYGDRNRKQQTFDKEKIFVTKQGQEINCFDAIQAANVDTNIYDVMKKYHCQTDEAIELMKARGGEQGIYADVKKLQSEIKDLGDVKKVMERADMLFEQLPTEIKQKYGNNPVDFYKAQEKIFKDLQEKQTEQNKVEQQTTEDKK